MEQIIAFVWASIASGVGYDAIKKYIGPVFGLLLDYKKTDRQAEFEKLLTDILQRDEELKNQLWQLANNKDASINIVNSQNINTGIVNVAGNFQQGDNTFYGQSESDIRHREEQIPSMAQEAFKQAYDEAITHGLKVTTVKDGQLVEVSPDGSIRVIKDLQKPHPVVTGKYAI